MNFAFMVWHTPAIPGQRGAAMRRISVYRRYAVSGQYGPYRSARRQRGGDDGQPAQAGGPAAALETQILPATRIFLPWGRELDTNYYLRMASGAETCGLRTTEQRIAHEDLYPKACPPGYEVEHLARLFYPMAPLTLTPPEPEEDCLWAEKASGPAVGNGASNGPKPYHDGAAAG